MDVIVEDLLFVALGTLLGFLSGIIPGVGNTIMILGSYPLLKDASLLQMLLYYIAIISSSQFSGSVVATVFGVPGESSSLPAVIEGNRMFHRGVGNFAISNAALGSILGAFVSVVVVYSVLPFTIELIKEFYNNNVQVIILLLATTSICVLMGKSIAQNVFVFAIGIFLGLVGTNYVPNYVFLPQIIPYKTFPLLLTDLPLFPIIISCYVFPVLLQTNAMFDGFTGSKKYVDNNRFIEHIKQFAKNISSSLRGSVFGCFIGLVPHIGASVASNLSYAIERKFGVKHKQYHTKGDIKTLVAAETANNSTGLVSMLPLILIGIPISASEAMLLGYIDINNYDINYETTVESGMFETIVIWFIGINTVSFLLAWPLVRYVNILTKINMKHMLWATGLALVALTYYLGAKSFEEVYYMSVLIGLLPLGYWLRKAEPMILMVAFILQDKLFASIHMFYSIHYG
jgi:putative tricarboxylic transport membrane protein